MRKPTTEARRHGERSVDLVIARDLLIGKAADSDQDVLVELTINPCHPERVGANATASRRTPVLSIPKHTASGSSYETKNLTAETRSRGEDQKLTTEAQRHGEDRDKEKLLELDCFRTTRQVSAFADHPITCDHQITRYTSARALITKAMRTLRAMLREIFDESAYDRFLLRTHASRSVASYRAFTRERDAAVLKKPRCC